MSILVSIGSGNMGYALMKGANNIPDTEILFSDTDIDKARSAADSLKAQVIKSNIEAANKGDFIFLAVKPQILPSVLSEIAETLKQRINSGTPPVVISMAAGWTVKKIQAAVSAMLPIARMMPNTPALIGKGLIAVAFSPEVSAVKTAELEKILGGAGIVDIIEEHYLDAVTGLSGSGPAFVYMFIEALADGGVRAGLPRDKALRYAAQTVLGSAAMVQNTEKHPGELKDMVTSPGGTTIAGIAALEEGAFRGTVIKAVEAAWRRSVELG